MERNNYLSSSFSVLLVALVLFSTTSPPSALGVSVQVVVSGTLSCPATTIAGQTATTRSPISNANVNLSCNGGGTVLNGALTDNQGKFNIAIRVEGVEALLSGSGTNVVGRLLRSGCSVLVGGTPNINSSCNALPRNATRIENFTLSSIASPTRSPLLRNASVAIRITR